MLVYECSENDLLNNIMYEWVRYLLVGRREYEDKLVYCLAYNSV